MMFGMAMMMTKIDELIEKVSASINEFSSELFIVLVYFLFGINVYKSNLLLTMMFCLSVLVLEQTLIIEKKISNS